jgi:hypothetical protein
MSSYSRCTVGSRELAMQGRRLMDAGLAVGIAGLAVGVVALVLVFLVPFIQRPRLEINESLWPPAGHFPWTFAVFQVRNKPLAAPLNIFLRREAAQGCLVEIDYFKWGTDEQIFPTITGRWSSHNPPVTWMQEPTGVVVTAVTGVPRQSMGPGYSGVYDPSPSLDPPEQNIAASERGEEVAVAVLQTISGFNAYAWSTESFKYTDWENPEWRLDYPAIYRIDVHVRGPGVVKKACFTLCFISANFNDFRLEKT